MSKKVKTPEPTPDGKRAYRSEHRAQQALATRRHIREQAERLFVENGYAATSITSIAEAAGVAPETVYATFKNKRNLLLEIEDVAITGDDEAVALLERDWVADALAITDQRERMRAITKFGIEAMMRPARIAGVLRSAADSDPELAKINKERRKARYGDTRRLVQFIADLGPLKVDFDAAVDLTYALCSASFYEVLVVDRGWSEDHFRETVTELLESLLP
jgi:AcrR family transcriptional regulator